MKRALKNTNTVEDGEYGTHGAIGAKATKHICMIEWPIQSQLATRKHACWHVWQLMAQAYFQVACLWVCVSDSLGIFLLCVYKWVVLHKCLCQFCVFTHVDVIPGGTTSATSQLSSPCAYACLLVSAFVYVCPCILICHKHRSTSWLSVLYAFVNL